MHKDDKTEAGEMPHDSPHGAPHADAIPFKAQLSVESFSAAVARVAAVSAKKIKVKSEMLDPTVQGVKLEQIPTSVLGGIDGPKGVKLEKVAVEIVGSVVVKPEVAELPVVKGEAPIAAAEGGSAIINTEKSAKEDSIEPVAAEA